MNQADAKKAILQQWMTAWPAASTAAAGSSVPFVFDSDAAPSSPTYARVRIIGGPREQYSLGAAGNRRYYCEGFVTVELRSPSDVGSKIGDKLADAVRTVLESQRLAATGTEAGVVTEAGSSGQESTSAQFWFSVVVVPFSYYETR